MKNEEKIISLISRINRNFARINNYGYRPRTGRKYNFGPDMRPPFGGRGGMYRNARNSEIDQTAPGFGRGYGRGYNRNGFSPRPGFGRGRERLLVFIKNKPGISQSELARIVDIRPQSLSEIVNKLVTDGFVKKENNAQDKRVVELYLTDEGKIRADEFRCYREEFASQSLSVLTESEQLQLIDLLEKINEQY